MTGKLHTLYEDLLGLIRRGQAPAIALLLRRRFLSETLQLGEAAWLGYGHGVAFNLARDLPGTPLEGLELDELRAVVDVLERGRNLPFPRPDREDKWQERSAEAIQLLGEAIAQLEAVLTGARPREEWGGAVGGAPGLSDGFAIVPVVARVVGAAKSAPIFRDLEAGLLVPICVRAETLLRETDRPLAKDTERETSSKTMEAFEASLQNLARLRIPGVPPFKKCLFRVSWGVPAGSWEGRSATLGFFLAAGAAWSAQALSRKRLGVEPRVAFTGGMTGTTVTEVDGRTLGHKIRAAFYSPVERLFVPEAQRELAEELAADLRSRHPDRRFEIRGMTDAIEVWSDSQAVMTWKRSAVSLAGTFVRRPVFASAVAGALVLVAAGIGYSMWQSYLDAPEAVQIKWEGTTLLIENRHGRTCGRFQTEHGMWREIKAVGPSGEGALGAVWDLDGDGIDEVVAAYCGGVRQTNRLTALDASGNPLWEIESTGDLPVPDSSLIWYNLFPFPDPQGMDILALRRSGQGSISTIQRIDGKTGNTEGQLWHPGHLDAVFIHDVNGTGRKVHCIVGPDNRTGMGMLAIYDLRQMRTLPKTEGDSLPPPLLDVEMFDHGLLVAMRFPKDVFSEGRAHCREFYEISEGLYQVFAHGTNGWRGGMLFGLRFDSEYRPTLVSVTLQDAHRQMIVKNDSTITQADFAREEKRLLGAVEWLSRDGWAPVSVNQG